MNIWFTVFESVILPMFGLGSFIPSQVSLWDNVNSFKDRPHYYIWDYGTYYTVTSDRFVICREYDGKPVLADFTNNIGTNFVINMLYFYIGLSYTACFLGVVVKMYMGYWEYKNRDKTHDELEQYEKTISRTRKMKNFFEFLAFVASVPCFYAFKAHYGDCVKVSGSVEFFMNDVWRILGVIGFFLVVFSPCAGYIALRSYYKYKSRSSHTDQEEKVQNVGRFIIFLYIAMCVLFFIQASVVNFTFNIPSQIAWNTFLTIDIALGLYRQSFKKIHPS